MWDIKFELITNAFPERKIFLCQSHDDLHFPVVTVEQINGMQGQWALTRASATRPLSGREPPLLPLLGPVGWDVEQASQRKPTGFVAPHD